MTNAKPKQSDPATLVAIANAAHQAGDRGLERAARRELLARHGIVIRFARAKKHGKENPL
jgi:hypothetical protein